MISNDLQNLCDWVIGFPLRHEPMKRQACVALAQALLDLASQVRAIEEVPLRLDSPEVRLGFHRMYEADDAC